MQKMIITVFLLSQVLFGAMFDTNSDLKHKYEFDGDVSDKNVKLAKELKKFQMNQVTQEEIELYLIARDDNTSTKFGDDVLVDKSLNLSAPSKANWIESIYESWFGSNDDVTNPEQGAE